MKGSMKDNKKAVTKKALPAYSSGEISRTELEKTTGLWFGEILLELAKLELPLPRFSAYSRYTPEQKKLHDEFFGMNDTPTQPVGISDKFD